MIVLKNVDLRNGDKILLHGANMIIQDGLMTCLRGKNGSGKTTLLYALAFMHSFDHVDIEWDHKPIDVCDVRFTTGIRRNQIALILQDNEMLFEENTMLQNIKIAFAMQHIPYQEAMVENLKNRVSLSFDETAYPASLSGGERKKFALLLALIKKPRCILCDEPSSSLDKKSAKQFIEALKHVCYEEHIMVLIVSHDDVVLQEGDVLYEIQSHTLVCKKGRGETENINVNKMEHQKVSFPFFKTYETCRKTQKKEWLLLCVMAVVLSFVAYSSPFLKAYEKQQIQMIDTYARNEIFITNTNVRTPNPMYHASTPSFTEEQNNILKEIDHTEIIYPYAQIPLDDDATWMIRNKKQVITNDKKLVFIPYYPEQKGFHENKMFYISDAARAMLQLEKHENIRIMHAVNGKDIELKKYAFLDASFVNKYSEVDAVIYFPMTMWDQFVFERNPNSYMVYADAFQNANEVANDISKWLSGVSVKYQFRDMSDLLSYIETVKNVFLMVQTSLLILMIMVVISINYRSLLDRNKEFLILKIHGLDNLHLMALLLYEQSRLLFRVVMIAVTIGGGVKILFSQLFSSQSFHVLSNIKMVMLYGGVCMGISLLCNVALAYRKQIFDQVRNE